MNNTATCEIQGRLANALYIAAHTISYAKMYGMKYHIPYYAPDMDDMLFPVRIIDNGQKPDTTTLYTEPLKNFDSPFGGDNPYFHLIDRMENIRFRGYFQSFKYFDWCRDYILRVFNLPYSKVDKVSIHVRLGDYVNLSSSFPSLGMDYYGKAINHFTELGYKEFIVFSDEIQKCKEKFTRSAFPNVDSFEFSEGRSPLEDLILQSSCAHNIVANSSFSFMAGWLNQNKDKIVICNAKEHLFKSCNMDFVPDYFTPIDQIGKKKLELPTVTLLAVATKDGDVEKTVEALKYSMRGVKFASAKLVSHYRPDNLPDDIEYEFIPKMKSIDEWNYHMVYNAWRHFDTEYMFLAHSDGFVVHPESWKKEFLEYDYLGAPWPVVPPHYTNPATKEVVRVGNSVGLRSRKLMKLPYEINMPWGSFEGKTNEDTFICVLNKHIFEKHGMEFAPLSVAKYFGHEAMLPETEGIKPFAFHRYAGANINYPKF